MAKQTSESEQILQEWVGELLHSMTVKDLLEQVPGGTDGDGGSDSTFLDGLSELTIYQVADFTPLFINAAQKGGPLIIDLSTLESYDCAGLQLLLKVVEYCEVRAISIQFLNIPKSLVDTLRLLQLDQSFQLNS